jgi:ribosomal protein L7Ae-like RNA K-turn-binding protein
MKEMSGVIKLLGLAHRAHKLSFGASATLTALQKGKARGVILALDISDNTRVKIENAAQTKHVPVIRFGSKNSLGSRFGREELGVIGVLDNEFAKGIKKFFE